MRIKYFLPFFILIFALTPLANASNYWHSSDWKQNFVISLAGGPGWANAENTQTIYFNNNYSNIYYNNQNQNNSIGIGELFIGTYQELTDTLQAQFGAEIAWSGTINPSGEVWENTYPQLHNYNYNYNINQFRASAKGKMVMEDFPVMSMIQPFVAGSVGLGLNHAYSFTTNALNPSTNNILFGNKTVYAFAYTIGGGLQLPINPFYQVGVGYEFSGWGKSQLSLAYNQYSDRGLTIDNIFTNAVIISLTYTA